MTNVKYRMLSASTGLLLALAACSKSHPGSAPQNEGTQEQVEPEAQLMTVNVPFYGSWELVGLNCNG